MHNINHAVVCFFSALGMAPRGMREVHAMLVCVARSLVAGGKTDTFTPMQVRRVCWRTRAAPSFPTRLHTQAQGACPQQAHRA